MKRWFNIGLAVLLLLLTSCSSPADWDALQAEIHAAYPDVKELEPDRLQAWLAAGSPVIVLDARSPDEYAVSRIPTAVRYRDAELPEQKDAVIVVYCSVGYRSAERVRQLQAEGYTKVWNLAGSLFRWAGEGRPLEREGAPVREVHPYDAEWGRFLDASVPRGGE